MGCRQRRWFCAAVALPLLLSVAPAAIAQNQGQTRTVPLRLSLRQALDLGLQQSLSLRSSSLSVAESQALQGLAKARFLPRLDLVALGTYAQVGSSVGFISNLPAIGDLNLSLGGDGYAVVQNSFLNLGLLLNLPLLDFSRAPLQQAARYGVQVAEAEQSEQQRRTRFDIESTYLSAQLAEAQIPVWERSLALSTTLLRDATAIRRQGLAARIDTLQADALLQADRQGLAEAQAQRQIALSALARLLNLPPEQPLAVSDSLQPGAAWPLTLAQSLERSWQQRPALQALEKQRQAQQAKVQLARAGRLPTVGLLLGAGISGDWLNLPVLNVNPSVGVNGDTSNLPSLNTPASGSGSFYDWGAAISLRQPLFDGGLSRESAALAQRRAEQSQVAIDQARQAISQNVITWFASHRAAATQMQAAAAAARAGEESVRDALLRYRAGITPITELLLAQRNLQVSRSAEAAAIHRWNLSRAGLELESGQLQPPDAAPPSPGSAATQGG
ncbi:MAG: TolC family protein [Synechococcaceae bacterium WB8_1B_136]|nr:TolC family protein [Synechococcaceae bacterium WB8_1B_136]